MPCPVFFYSLPTLAFHTLSREFTLWLFPHAWWIVYTQFAKRLSSPPHTYFTTILHLAYMCSTNHLQPFFFFAFFFLHILYTVWVFGKIPALCLSMLFAEYPNCFPPTHMIYMEFTPCSACALQWVLHMLYNEFALCRHALYTAFTSALHKDMPCLHIVYTWFATIFKDPLFTWALQVYMVFAHSTPFQSVLCR